MTRPLSDPLPLRDTSVWPHYDSITIIPRVYGQVRVQPLRYNAAGTHYVVADHAITAVDSVTVDGAPVGYFWRNGADDTGHACAFIELNRAPDTRAQVVAEVRGLDSNPATILHDMVPHIDLQDFAIHCRNQGLRLDGAFTARMTLRAAIQFVVAQVGAVWSAGLPGFAVPFPPSNEESIWAAFSQRDITDWQVHCDLSELVTRVTVPFDWDDVDGKARQSLILEAPSAIQAHGIREAELALPWVRSVRQAVATATTWLQWRAGPLWTLRFSASAHYRALQPGGWVSVWHPRLPAIAYVLTDCDPGYGTGTVILTAQAPPIPAPSVSLVRGAAVFAAITTEYALQVGMDTVTMTITDEAGQKLQGARVWLDDRGPITTDAAAKVTFQATAGTHVLRIERDGRNPVVTEIRI